MASRFAGLALETGDGDGGIEIHTGHEWIARFAAALRHAVADVSTQSQSASATTALPPCLPPTAQSLERLLALPRAYVVALGDRALMRSVAPTLHAVVTVQAFASAGAGRGRGPGHGRAKAATADGEGEESKSAAATATPGSLQVGDA